MNEDEKKLIFEYLNNLAENQVKIISCMERMMTLLEKR